MTQINLYDPEPSFSADRNEAGDVILKIRTKEGTINISVGSSYDDAEQLRDQLADVAASITREILDGWEDTPSEWDGYVSYDRGAYRAQFSGKEIGDRHGFPTGDIAVYRLAEAMAQAGEFRAAWFEGEHGPSQRNINSEVRAFHDKGGSKMKPLPGVQYAEGDVIRETGGDWPMVVDRDYGELGIDTHTSGDPDVRQFIPHAGRGKFTLIHEDKS